MSCNEAEQSNTQFVTFENSEISYISKDKSIIELELTFKIKDGYHIQTEVIENENLIATEFHIDEIPNEVVLINQSFNYKKHLWKLDDGSYFNVITNTFKIHLTLSMSKNTKSNKKYALSELFYQTCDDKKCYFPRTLEVKIPI